MALQVTQLKRRFVIKDEDRDKEIILDDPGAHLTPEEVVKHYAPIYPQITTAQVSGPKVEGKTAVFSISSNVGTLG